MSKLARQVTLPMLYLLTTALKSGYCSPQTANERNFEYVEDSNSKYDYHVNYFDHYEDNENLTSVIPFCCDRHHYFEPENATCEQSETTLNPVFHRMDGSKIEDGLRYRNRTAFVPCDSYILPHSEFALLPNGELRLHTKLKLSPILIPVEKYCIIWIGENATREHMEALICFPNADDVSSRFFEVVEGYLFPIGMSISAAFLAATFVVYCLLPELQDLLGKCLMCSVASLCLSKMFGVLAKVLRSLPHSLCVIVGLMMHGGFLVAFFWLNFLSFVIFVTIWLQRKIGAALKRNWFFVGCFYAFGGPLVIMTLLLIHNFTSQLDNSLIPKPGLGEVSCGFSNRGANILYFYVPVSILLGINLILFCMSAFRLFFLTKQTTAKKIQFKHYLKLFLLMGIPWIFEVLSFFFSDMQTFSVSAMIWLIFDIFNALQGVIIFIVFVWREPILAKLAEMVIGVEYAKKKYPEVYLQQTCDEVNCSYDLGLSEVKKTSEEQAQSPVAVHVNV